jgi:hypothetical protein
VPIMRRQKVLRFLLICLFTGAFVGLLAGLAFGGGAGGGTLRVATNPVVGAQQTETTEADDPFAGQTMTPERAKLIGANEMGLVLVVVYNKISTEATDASTRTPDQLRDDLALLGREGFYPINIRDLVTGDIDIPAGKSPVAITFDGSSPGQYRILDDDSMDPNCAVGIMQSLVSSGYWQPKATFFCLLDTVPNENEVFGQPERRKEKLRNLVDWGYEVGSNTKTNLDLSSATQDSILSELAESQSSLDDLIGSDYAVSSVALPKGGFPRALGLLQSGTWQDYTYTYTAAVGLDNTLCASPYSTVFDPMHIPRIASAGDNLAVAIDELKSRTELLYISDGDPTSVSAPADLVASLGQTRDDLGRPIIRY